MTTLGLYLICGAAAGLLAGLLGIGGGLVVVPLLYAIFTADGAVPKEMAMHLAVGTSLSSIMFTAVSSARAHARRGSVLWPMAWKLAPGIALGTAVGSAAAAVMSTLGLKIFFACFLVFAAIQMLGDFYPSARKTEPGRTVLTAAGLVIGAVSSLAGLGGGTLSVPFLRWCGVDLRRAVGTSAAIGWAIAAAGSLGFAAHGWGAPGLPAHSLGYISLPATCGVAASSIFLAPVGARLSHALPTPTLRKVFAAFLFLMAARLFWSLAA